jgi:hypothetical protein
MRRRHAYDDSSGCVALTLRVYQEEGGYEYISDHQGSENGKQEAHLESGVLYPYRNRAAKSARRRKRLCGSARTQRVARGRWKPVPGTQAYSAKSGTGSIGTSSNLSSISCTKS